MTKRFRVAGHLFELTMEDSCPLWKELGNYAPFEVRDEGEEVIFSLSLVESLAAHDRTPLLVDTGEPGMPGLDLYSEDDGFWLEMAPVKGQPVCGLLRMNAACTSAELMSMDAGKFCIDNALMLVYAFRTACLGTLEMHSSVIMHGGMGYMFLGKSGAGKSTHSRMWLENIGDCELMNDDNPIIRIYENGDVMVYGSPWSGKTPCYKNVVAPVGGLVSIVQAPQNSIRKMSPVEAYVILSASVSGFRSDRKMADGLFETMNKLIVSVGFYELECLPDAAAAQLCKENISK
ncbi:MAG: hypothetical protein MJY89_08450 [Bacteroidales bacterium]|nr:hypothetical protein [Bacteroidales bacterium]